MSIIIDRKFRSSIFYLFSSFNLIFLSSQQLEAERSKGEKSVMTHASRSSTSALLTLYKTLKSSPLQQHQQLLNILMNDPLKLAKVIKQVRFS